MIISQFTFNLLIGIACFITLFTPFILLSLLIRDWKKGELW
jgi:hypothetical protein